jgi:parallel beta-helix repeat protein
MRKIVVFALILISLLTLSAVRIQPIKAQYERNVTIKADGTVLPSTAPIEHNGNIYTVTADIQASVYLYRNNTILNGAGHTVQIIEGPQSIEVNYYWQVTPIANIVIGNITVNNGYIGFSSLVNSTIANNTIIIGKTNYPGIGIGFTGGKCVHCSIYGNKITNAYDGIRVYGSNNSIFGNHIENCKVALSLKCADSKIFANYISAENGTAIFLDGGSNLKIFQNHILNSKYGVWCTNINGQLFSNNVIYGNDFINVSESVINRALMAPNPVNSWDNGYVGNYWSDYQSKYPNASEVDASGIGDTPYVIDTDNMDRYPLLEPIIAGPPKISVLSPLAQTYNETSVSLVFALGKLIDWTAYSLDGKENVTVVGNVTLSGLSSGLHNVTVYTEDLLGRSGGSDTVWFNVAEPFPTLLVVASVVSLAVLGVFLLVYFKKRKH